MPLNAIQHLGRIKEGLGPAGARHHLGIIGARGEQCMRYAFVGLVGLAGHGAGPTVVAIQ